MKAIIAGALAGIYVAFFAFDVGAQITRTPAYDVYETIIPFPWSIPSQTIATASSPCIVTPSTCQEPGYNYADHSAVVEAFSSGTSDPDAAMWNYFLSRPHPNVTLTEHFFDAAAQEFGVPPALLKVIGQVESNWTQIGPSIDQGWGIMHLVSNEYCDTLEKAAELLDLPIETLKEDPLQNIRGAAAVIADFAGQDSTAFTGIEDWFDAVKLFTGLVNEELRELQAQLYYSRLKKGHLSSTLWNEKIFIEPIESINIEDKLIYSKQKEAKNGEKSTDYGPAISDLTPCNYTSGRTHAIDAYVNHYVGTGTYAGAISWFHTCRGDLGTSAQFVIRCSDGEITQVVRLADTAWHCGASGYPYNNSRSTLVQIRFLKISS